MRILEEANGGINLSIREYDIAAATEIVKGQVVKLSEGLVISAVVGETGAILGIAMENHSGAADALNPRSNGTKILVCDAPELIMACPAFEITATGGSATTVTASTLAAYSADDWNGGYLKLISKASGSTNTDPIGSVKRIADYAYNSTGTVSTFTVASGGTANEGDKYLLFPPLGLAAFNLDSTKTKLVNTAKSATSLKVVGYDIDAKMIKLIAAKHFLGNYAG